MKKELKLEEAIALLRRGETVECQLSFRADDVETVLTEDRLQYLYDLSQLGIQKCKIFERIQDKVNIPDDAIEISFDEAYTMVFSGELVFYQEDGEEEEITSISELINLRKNFDIRGKHLFLYWHE